MNPAWLLLLAVPVLLYFHEPAGPDLTPVGGGLAVVGLSIILAAFVLRLIK